jgi:cell division protein FtsI (penicillin-binding protein 3)
MATIGESLDAGDLLQTFKNFGLGEATAGAVLGKFETPGILDENYRRWTPQRKATLSYGYGLSVTALQLARAYAAIGSGGWLTEVQLEVISEQPERRRVMRPEMAADLMGMLEGVVASDYGTGRRASIPNYRVAGKTGTAKIERGGNYSADRYRAVFAGIAPVSHPRFAAVVVISDPRGAEYGGGEIAAPVFSRVIGKALSMYSVAPDRLDDELTQLSRLEAGR